MQKQIAVVYWESTEQVDIRSLLELVPIKALHPYLLSEYAVKAEKDSKFYPDADEYYEILLNQVVNVILEEGHTIAFITQAQGQPSFESKYPEIYYIIVVNIN